MKRLLLIPLAICLLFKAVSAKENVTFQNLHETLTKDQLSRFIRNQYELEVVQQGEVVSQTLLADRIKREGMPEIAYQLYRQIYKENGFDLANLEAAELIWEAYWTLAKMSLDGEHNANDPVLAFRLMTHLARQQGGYYQESLTFEIGYSDLLPDTANLSELWEKYQPGQPETTLEQVGYGYNDMTVEDSADLSLFSACTSAFGKSAEIMTEYDRLQFQMLSDGEVTADEIEQAYQAIAASHDGFGKSPITFNFQDIELRPLMALIFDVLGVSALDIKFDDSVPDHRVNVYTENVPIIVLYAQIIEGLGLSVSCHEQRVRFSASQADSHASGIIVFGNFLSQKSVDASSEGNESGVLEWTHGPRYEGQLQAGVPHGDGRFEGLNRNMTLTGVFDAGVVNGVAEFIDDEGKAFYRGQYKSGLRHGKGHYRNDWEAVEFNGQFDEGMFTGDGKQYYRRSDDDYRVMFATHPEPERWITYSGPFVNSTPHGDGQCESVELSYPCTFHDGVLVAVGDVSLLP